jgi:hypothetical protein
VTGPTDPRDDRIATPSTNAAPPDGRALATEERPQPDAPERKIGDGSKWDCPNEQHETQAHERQLISKWCPDCEHALRVKLEAELREAREEREGLRTAWHAEIRASAIIDKAAADAMVSTVREAHDLRAQLAARDALLARIVEAMNQRDTCQVCQASHVLDHMRTHCEDCVEGDYMDLRLDGIAAAVEWEALRTEARDLVRRAGGKT